MNQTLRTYKFWNILFLLLTFNVYGFEKKDECSLGSTTRTLTDWSGVIRSPTIDGTYLPNETCVWVIQLPQGTRVNLDIIKIDLEYLNYSEEFKDECRVDYIQVSTITSEFRECRKPRSWTSDANVVNIKFHTDRIIQKSGFVLNYTGVCGNHFSYSNGPISLKIPRLLNKATQLHCNWTIDLDGNQVPSLNFIRKGKSYLFKESSWKIFQNGKPYEDIRIGDDSFMINISQNAVTTLTIIYNGLSADTERVEKETDQLITAVEIIPIGPYCEEDTFIYNNIEFSFTKTAVGFNRTLPCPDGVNGTIIRRCFGMYGEPTWSRPDLTYCVNPVILQIDTKVSQFKQQSVIHKRDILTEMGRLYNATSSVDSLELFPGDMLVSTNIVGKISELIPNTTHDSVDEFQDVSQSYADVVGSIIDTNKLHIWKNIEFDFVEYNMAFILKSVEKLSANIAKKKLSQQRRKRSNHFNHDIHVNSKFVEFSISSVEPADVQNNHLTFNMGDNTSSIMLTSSVFEIALGNTEKQNIQLYNGRFSSIAGILMNAKTEQIKYTSTNESQVAVVNSDIVSSKVLNVPEEKFNSLNKPITIIFQLQNSTLNFYLQQNCVFMNMTARSPKYRWSTDGCQVDGSRSNITHTVCTCSHLTNFAVLMDIFQVSESEDVINYQILSYISYIGGGLSLVCCAIAITVYEYFRLKKERVRIHEQFAISIIMVQLIFLAGIDRTENKYVCMSVAIALHYFLLSMFCWMLVEGFHLYVMLVKVFRTRTNFKKYLIIGWGVPVVIVSVSAGIFYDKYGNTKVCWLSHEMLLIAFVPAIVFVIFVNTIILLMVLRITMRSMASLPKYNSEDRSVIRSGLKAAAILLPLLGLTWTFGFLSINNKETIIFTYLFTFFNSLQGVFFFFFHCLLSVDVQNAYHRHSYRKSLMSFTYSTSKTATGKKPADWNSSYSNDSKSSSRTHLTDVSNVDTKSTTNRDDRLHRNPDMFREVWLKDNISNPRNLFRSHSDGIPYWKQNDSHLLFRRSMSYIDSFANVDPYDLNSTEKIAGGATLSIPHVRIPRLNTKQAYTNNVDHYQQSDNNGDIYKYQNRHNQSDVTYSSDQSTRSYHFTNNQSDDPMYLADNESVNQTGDDDVFVPGVRQISEYMTRF